MTKFQKALTLFLTFFKIGAFTFGGGYAMIPLIQHEVAQKHKWVSDDDILDIVAIAESTPGPIAINTATFVGYKVCGVFGAVCAILGVVLPSFLIIFGISFALEAFQHLRVVKYAFMGIRAGVLALIVKALMTMFKKCPKDWVSYTVIIFAAVMGIFTDINTFLIIITSAVFGLVSYSIIRGRAKK